MKFLMNGHTDWQSCAFNVCKLFYMWQHSLLRYMHEMQAIAIDGTGHLSVCLSHSFIVQNMAEQMKVPCGVEIGEPSNIVLYWSPIFSYGFDVAFAKLHWPLVSLKTGIYVFILPCVLGRCIGRWVQLSWYLLCSCVLSTWTAVLSCYEAACLPQLWSHLWLNWCYVLAQLFGIHGWHLLTALLEVPYCILTTEIFPLTETLKLPTLSLKQITKETNMKLIVLCLLGKGEVPRADLPAGKSVQHAGPIFRHEFRTRLMWVRRHESSAPGGTPAGGKMINSPTGEIGKNVPNFASWRKQSFSQSETVC